MVRLLRIVVLFQLVAISAFALPDAGQMVSDTVRERLQVPFEVLWAGWDGYQHTSLQHYVAPIREALELVSEMAPPDLERHPFRFQQPAGEGDPKIYLHVVLANSQRIRVKTNSGFKIDHTMQVVQNSRTFAIEENGKVGIFMVLRLDDIAETTPRGPQKNTHEVIRRRMFAELTELYGIPSAYLGGLFALNLKTQLDNALFHLRCADATYRTWQWISQPQNRAKLPPEIVETIDDRYGPSTLRDLQLAHSVWRRTLPGQTVVPVDYTRWGASSFFKSGPGAQSDIVSPPMQASWLRVTATMHETDFSLFKWDKDFWSLHQKKVAFHTVTASEYKQIVNVDFPRETLHGTHFVRDQNGRWTLNIYFLVDRIAVDPQGQLFHANEMEVRWAIAMARAHFGPVAHFLKTPPEKILDLAGNGNVKVAVSAFTGSSEFLESWLRQAVQDRAPQWVVLSEAVTFEKQGLTCALQIAGQEP